MKTSLGFWAMVVLILVRSWSVGPALVARGPGILPRVSVAAAVFALYIANTVVTARRIRAADAATAASLIWMLAATGLVLAAALLSLV